MSRLLHTLGAALVGLVYVLSSALAQSQPVFIVNRANPTVELSASDVSDFFLKKRTHWANGDTVRFVDWKEGLPLRASFLDKVVGKSSRDVELYWIGQKLYSGDSAPLRATSDAMVVRFVSRFPGAIGYVSDAGAIANSPGVKQVSVSGLR